MVDPITLLFVLVAVFLIVLIPLRRADPVWVLLGLVLLVVLYVVVTQQGIR